MIWINKIKQKGIPRLLLKFTLFLTILFILDFSMGSLLKYLYYKENSGDFYRTTYSIDSTKAEILIFGSSTADHNYYSKDFEKRIKMSTYNTGSDGTSIFYHYAILKCVLKRYSPKIAILDLSINEFIKDQKSYDRISSLLPYYKNHPEIRSIIQLKSQSEKIKLLSKIYPYNSTIFTSAIRNSDLNEGKKRDYDEQGYVPLTKIWNKTPVVDTAIVNYELDSNKINLYKAFIRDCNNSNVKLYFVISPRFIKYKYMDTSLMLAKKIASESNIPLYDFFNDSLFFHTPGVFEDPYHLNDKGAKIFTQMVINKIMQSRQKTPLVKELGYQ